MSGVLITAALIVVILGAAMGTSLVSSMFLGIRGAILTIIILAGFFGAWGWAIWPPRRKRRKRCRFKLYIWRPISRPRPTS